jgi:hypothetical protein
MVCNDKICHEINKNIMSEEDKHKDISGGLSKETVLLHCSNTV